jgi:hypothetical protein
MNNDDNEKICQKCGFIDTGKFCSNCGQLLTEGKYNIYKEIYYNFVSRFFEKLPFLGKLIKTCFISLFIPGKINIQESYLKSSNYLHAFKYLTTIFYFAVASAIIKSVLSFEAIDSNMSLGFLVNYIGGLFTQIYVVWIFGFLTIGYIWAGNYWKKRLKIDKNKSGIIDSIIIYEVGTILIIVLIIFWAIGLNFDKENNKLIYNISLDNLIYLLSGLFIFIYVHFFILLIKVGYQENILWKKLILNSLLITFLLSLFILGAEFITIPIILVPLLVILSPIYYILRGVYKRVLILYKKIYSG